MNLGERTTLYKSAQYKDWRENCTVSGWEREMHCVKLGERTALCKVGRELHCVKLGEKTALCKAGRGNCTV